jgi:hypothetical protein
MMTALVALRPRVEAGEDGRVDTASLAMASACFKAVVGAR